MSNINGGIYLLNLQPTPATHSGDTVRFPLYTFKLGGGTLGPNDGIQFTTFFTCNSSANNKTFEIDFGSTNIFQLTVTNSLLNLRIGYIFNQNSLSVQKASRLAGTIDYSISSTANCVSSAENTANDLNITFYGTLSAAAVAAGESVGLASMFAQAIKTTSNLT